jgi:hypothetical protein
MSVNKETKARIAIALTIGLLMIIGMSGVYAATPNGPISITHVSNSTSATVGTGTLRSGDDGGYITTVTLDALQQNFGWKAYVGNITGKLTLDNAGGDTIYDWTLASVNANVYIARVDNVQWASLSCADRTVIGTEDGVVGKQPTRDESIIKTFIETVHKQFTVAGITIGQSTCPAISTFTSDTPQVAGIANLYQEILLNDSAGNLIYTTKAETGGDTGYDGNTYDFQAIVADDETPVTITNYYFYVEIGN